MRNIVFGDSGLFCGAILLICIPLAAFEGGDYSLSQDRDLPARAVALGIGAFLFATGVYHLIRGVNKIRSGLHGDQPSTHS
jgi:hypothetical protein